jgi:hypothetical protein
MTSTELMRAALSHATRGWRVFPLRPDDQRPAIRDWESRATTDPLRIRRAWQRGPFGIGIACGPSGLVVLDLDRPKPDVVRPLEWGRPGINDGADVGSAGGGDEMVAHLADALDHQGTGSPEFPEAVPEPPR